MVALDVSGDKHLTVTSVFPSDDMSCNSTVSHTCNVQYFVISAMSGENLSSGMCDQVGLKMAAKASKSRGVLVIAT